MTYIKNIWVDQSVERPKTYEITNNDDGSVTLLDSFGLISEIGTPVNADNMNHIEEGIENNDKRISILEEEGLRANIDLSNLSETGEKHFLNYSQVTDCIKSIDRKIVIQLSDGTITLKAGSVVTYPNGSGNFDEVTITEDKTFSYSGSTTNKQGTLFLTSAGNLSLQQTALCTSGTTAPAGTGMFWNTTTNKITYYTSGTAGNSGFSLPLCNVTFGTEVGGIGSVDKIFGGIGYMGSTVFVNKGVTVLIPNGRNSDGTLNNTEYTTESVLTLNVPNSQTPFMVFLVGNGTLYISAKEQFDMGNRRYDFEKNRYVSTSSNLSWCHIADLVSETTSPYKITEFEPRYAFRSVNYSEMPIKSICMTKPSTTSTAKTDNPAVVVENYISGSSWYRVWSDGWIEQGGVGSAKSATITLLKAYSNSSYTLTVGGSTGIDPYCITNITATSFLVATSQSASGYRFSWYACGY